VNEVFTASVAGVAVIQDLFYLILVIVIVKCGAGERRFSLREQVGVIGCGGFQEAGVKHRVDLVGRG